MNKFLVIAAAFTVVAVGAQGPGGPKSEEFRKNMEECKAETGATDEDMKGMKHHHPTTEKGWCVMGCINKKIGVMGADNKINLDKLQQVLAGMKEHHPERYEKLMSATQSCKPEVESKAANTATACTAAKAMGECVHSKM